MDAPEFIRVWSGLGLYIGGGYKMASGFGQCPNCGKMPLIVVAEERDEEGNLIDIKVKCAGCGYNHWMKYIQ